jgi:diguanylate cyclase (GGDEF)-like protein
MLLAAVAAGYYVVGRLSLQFAFDHPSASPVWPPTGIALALVLLLSARIWPAIFVGAFLVNLATAGSVLTSLGIAVGNTVEALVGGLLVWRYAGGHDALARTPNLFRFVLLAALASTAISATIGVGSLALGSYAEAWELKSLWLTWWLGDAAGALIVTPLILAWTTNDLPPPRPHALGEVVLLGVALVLVTQLVFGELLPPAMRHYPVEFFCMPFLLWAALRFEQRGAATASALLATLSVFGTLRGYGPFVDFPTNESLQLMQAYTAVMAVTALMVAAVVSERREIAERLRHLAVSDPLTGLANYRLLVDRLHAEVARSKRTGRGFAVLFMDLDGLKRINDTLGHVTGNRALQRLARALKDSCRSVDLIARFGGDEFVVVMPESDDAHALIVTQRIEARLARSTEQPSLRISTGLALHPLDGDDPDGLLKAADSRLYAARQLARSRS